MQHAHVSQGVARSLPWDWMRQGREGDDEDAAEKRAVTHATPASLRLATTSYSHKEEGKEEEEGANVSHDYLREKYPETALF